MSLVCSLGFSWLEMGVSQRTSMSMRKLVGTSFCGCFLIRRRVDFRLRVLKTSAMLAVSTHWREGRPRL